MRKTRRLRVEIEGMSAEAKRKRWARSGKANPMYGRHHSDEARTAVSQANAGHSRNKGCRRSAETKARLSKIASARIGELNHFYGRKHTASSKAKIAEAKKGQRPSNLRPVMVDGKRYEGVTDAARAIGVSPSLIIYRIKSNKWSYHYL